MQNYLHSDDYSFMSGTGAARAMYAKEAAGTTENGPADDSDSTYRPYALVHTHNTQYLNTDLSVTAIVKIAGRSGRRLEDVANSTQQNVQICEADNPDICRTAYFWNEDTDVDCSPKDGFWFSGGGGSPCTFDYAADRTYSLANPGTGGYSAPRNEGSPYKPYIVTFNDDGDNQRLFADHPDDAGTLLDPFSTSGVGAYTNAYIPVSAIPSTANGPSQEFASLCLERCVEFNTKQLWHRPNDYDKTKNDTSLRCHVVEMSLSPTSSPVCDETHPVCHASNATSWRVPICSFYDFTENSTFYKWEDDTWENNTSPGIDHVGTRIWLWSTRPIRAEGESVPGAVNAKGANANWTVFNLGAPLDLTN